jgi:hypothetical protein
MADAPSFAKLVPGFDFLQGLVKNAGAALPSIGQWVAPTLDPDELEKRISDLKTVQFWLEQNARMLGATIQALEVQKMTLSTLRTMNVQMADLRDSLTIRLPEVAKKAADAAKAEAEEEREEEEAEDTEVEETEEVEKEEADAEEAEVAKPAPAPAPAPARRKSAAKASAGKDKSTAEAATSSTGNRPVDPLQWWGALTKQFTELAANAIKETTGDAARGLAGQAMKKPVEKAAGAAPAKKKRAPAKGRKRAPARKRTAAKA